MGNKCTGGIHAHKSKHFKSPKGSPHPSKRQHFRKSRNKTRRDVVHTSTPGILKQKQTLYTEQNLPDIALTTPGGSKFVISDSTKDDNDNEEDNQSRISYFPTSLTRDEAKHGIDNPAYEDDSFEERTVWRSSHPSIMIPDDITVFEYMRINFGWYKKAPALVDGNTGETYTYHQIYHIACNVAKGLKRAKFRKKDSMMLISENRAEFAILFFAVASLGGKLVLVNPNWSTELLGTVLSETGANFVVTSHTYVDKTINICTNKQHIKKIFMCGKTSHPSCLPLQTLFGSRRNITNTSKNFNSRKTGVLVVASEDNDSIKLVELTHYNLISAWIQISDRDVLKLRPGQDSVLGAVPYYNVFSFVVVLCSSLLQGCQVITYPEFKVNKLPQAADKYMVSVLPLTHDELSLFPANPKQRNVTSLDMDVFLYTESTTDLKSQDLDRLRKWNVKSIRRVYGKPETCGIICVSEPYGENANLAELGQIVPNAELKITISEEGVREDIQFRGPNVSRRGSRVLSGKYNHRDMTWHDTGDKGYVDDSGVLYSENGEDSLTCL